MRMKATSGGGNGGEFELPPDDNHKAAVVALIDLGTHAEVYGDGGEKMKRKMLVAYELLDARKKDGSRFVVGHLQNLSLHEKANLRSIFEAALGRKIAEGEEVDFEDMLGRAVRVSISHTEKNGKTYHKIEAVTKADKKDQGKAKLEFAPYLYSLDDEEDFVPHSWLPWTYHEGSGKRLPPEKVLELCRENAGPAKGKARPAAPDADDDGNEGEGEGV